MLKKGAKGPAVLELQNLLLSLGYSLPRWGADGDLGEETLEAAADFAEDHGLPEVEGTIPDALLLALRGAAGAAPTLPPAFEDHTALHPPAKPKHTTARPWSSITGITLHQTACLLGENPPRWYSVPAHVGVTRRGRILYLHSLSLNVPHGNGLNARTVGVEIDGTFEGVEGDRKTWWPSPGYKGPMTPTPEQLEASRDAVRWIVEEVARHGGRVRFIHAHRQSSASRESDPGSRIWQEVGVWAQRELGLSDGGPGFVVAKGGVAQGSPIPESWDPRYKGVRY
jgi:hypothetical protein